ELAQRVCEGEFGKAATERLDGRSRSRIVDHGADEVLQRLLVGWVGIGPARLPLALPSCLLHVGAHALSQLVAVVWIPQRDQSLEEQISIGGGGRAIGSMVLRYFVQSAGRFLPQVRDLRQRDESHTCVFPAFVIVRRRGEQVMRIAVRPKTSV